MNVKRNEWVFEMNENVVFKKKFVQVGVVVRVSIYFWMRYAPRKIGSCYCDM